MNSQQKIKVKYITVAVTLVTLALVLALNPQIFSDSESEDQPSTKKESELIESETRTEGDMDSPFEVDRKSFEPEFTPNLKAFQGSAIVPFASIDHHARSCPKSEEVNLDRLAAYLQRKASTDIEKARAIYVWLTKNIRYDDEGYNLNLKRDYSAESVLKSRKAVCAGFSNLYLALGKKMNLPIVEVYGYAKGYGYSVGQAFEEVDHAWNLIKIADQWRVFDATWGEGYGETVNGKLVSRKRFDNYWFNVNPYESIFSHMPQNVSLTYVEPKLDLRTFENLPWVSAAYFQMGFDGKRAYREIMTNKSLQFPECYAVSLPVTMVKAPKYKFLSKGTTYSIELQIPEGKSVAAINSKNEWTYFTKENERFKLDYTANEIGELSIAVQYKQDVSTYHTILIYSINQRQSQ